MMVEILVLHNDQVVQQLCSSILKLAGYNCSCINDREKTLGLLRNTSIDLLIMPYMLPDDWYWEDMYDLIKREPGLQNIGIIILLPKSDRDDTYEKLEELLANGDSFLIMPFVPEDLVIATEKVLEHYGKKLPTIEERKIQFEQCQAELIEVYNQ